MKVLPATLRAFAAALLLAPTLPADVVAIPASKDNTLYESGTGHLSNGAGEGMFAGVTAMAAIRRALVAFDVSGSVPAGATIHGVSLRLTRSMANFGPDDFGFHRVLADWGEGTSVAGGGLSGGGNGAPTTPGDATWIHTFSPGSTWTTPGGDYVGVASAIETFTWEPTSATTRYITSADMTTDAQNWLDNPGQNFGWLIRCVEEVSLASAKRFDTREHPDALRRPMLFVCFTALGGEPGVPFCFGDGTGTACPCGNESSLPCEGCKNSGGRGMRLNGAGTTSIIADDLALTATQVPPNNTGIFYTGTMSPGNVLYDGIQCAGGSVRRFQGISQNNGSASDTNFVAQAGAGYFVAGVTQYFQFWSRDVAAGPTPCGTGANFSTGYAVTMTL